MKFKYLEFIRGTAALLVLINHIIGNHPAIIQNRPLLLTALGAWGTEAVIVFFVLSGIVINHVHTTNPKRRGPFLKRRAIRILPIYYACILLAILVDYFTNTALITERILGTSFFVATLQGALTFPITTIVSAWSLSFEMFFYVVFAFTIGKNQKQLIGGWAVVSILCCIFYYFEKTNLLYTYLINMFSFSSLWLAGYYIYEFKDNFKTDLKTAVFAISIIPLANRLHLSNEYYNVAVFLVIAILTSPMFLLALHRNSASVSDRKIVQIKLLHIAPVYLIILVISIVFSKSLLVSKLLYGSLPVLALTLIISNVDKGVRKLISFSEIFITYTGTISFALYLIHVPIIHFIGRNWPESVTIGVISIFILSYATSIFLEKIYQKHWVTFLKFKVK